MVLPHEGFTAPWAEGRNDDVATDHIRPCGPSARCTPPPALSSRLVDADSMRTGPYMCHCGDKGRNHLVGYGGPPLSWFGTAPQPGRGFRSPKPSSDGTTKRPTGRRDQRTDSLRVSADEM